MTDVKKDVWEHWSQCLKCAICFCCLQDPHTLECGHTFCKKCLKKLAGYEREDNPGVPRRRLLLVCPTCRNMFPAKPTLKEKTSTNICMKHLVEMWAKECERINKSAVVNCRSISTQTLPTTVALKHTHNPILCSSIFSHDLDSKPNTNISTDISGALGDLPKPSAAKCNKCDQDGDTEIIGSSIKDSFSTNKHIIPSPIRSPSLTIKSEPTEKISSGLDIFPVLQATLQSDVSPTSDEVPCLSPNPYEIPPCDTTTKNAGDVSDEEFVDRICPDQQYLKILLKCVSEYYEDLEENSHWTNTKVDNPSNTNEEERRRSPASIQPATHRTTRNAPPVDQTANVNGDNSSSSETDTSRSSSISVALNQSRSDASLSEVFGRISLSGLTLRREFTIGRVMLIVLWCVYSVIIVSIADSLMPYITVATFFTLLLFLG